MKHGIRSIIENRKIIPWFQPIASFSQKTIIGFEASIRGPSETTLHIPSALYATAGQHNCLTELELLAQAEVIQQFCQLSLSGMLFLKMQLDAVMQYEEVTVGALIQSLEGCQWSLDRLILVLDGYYTLYHQVHLEEIIKRCQSIGLQIALNHVGAKEAADPTLLRRLQPDYLKLDQHFIHNIFHDPIKQQLVTKVRAEAGGTCHIIAEGVDHREDYLALQQLGIATGQGHYFAQSRPIPPIFLPHSLFVTDQHHIETASFHTSEQIINLAIPAFSVTSNTLTEKVIEYFQKNSQLTSVPVVDSGIPQGIIRRSQLMNLFLNRYGRDLYARKTVNLIMDTNPLIVPGTMSVESVSQKITNALQQHHEVDNDFIIMDNQHYFGIGRVLDLLRKITELQLQNARYANPLTLLPGNVPINNKLDQCLAEQTFFAVCYTDLDNFKPFNDKYGYSMGDKVIKTVANCLLKHADSEQDFIGHVGGDDFVAIFKSPDWTERCQRVLDDFAKEVAGYYNEEDLTNGGIQSKDRQGNDCFFGILSLSIGAVLPDHRRCGSYHDISFLATNAKHEAKKIPGNSLFVDRRHGLSQSHSADFLNIL